MSEHPPVDEQIEAVLRRHLRETVAAPVAPTWDPTGREGRQHTALRRPFRAVAAALAVTVLATALLVLAISSGERPGLVGSASVSPDTAARGTEPPPAPSSADTSATPEPGISRGQAIELALQHSEDADASVASAESAPLHRFLTVLDEDPDRLVWAVVLEGVFPHECPGEQGSVPTCGHSKSKLVILDFHTGAFIVAESPSPR